MREATSAAILSAAEEVFAARGVQSARVEEIATQAGIAVGTLYNYFADRDALLAALLEVRRAELMAHLDEAMERSKGETFDVRLGVFLRAMFSHCEAHRAFMAILVQVDPSAPKVHGLKHPREAMLPVYRAAQDLVADGVAQGRLQTTDSDVFAAILIGMLRGVILRELDQGVPGALPARADLVARIFLRGAST